MPRITDCNGGIALCSDVFPIHLNACSIVGDELLISAPPSGQMYAALVMTDSDLGLFVRAFLRIISRVCLLKRESISILQLSRSFPKLRAVSALTSSGNDRSTMKRLIM